MIPLSNGDTPPGGIHVSTDDTPPDGSVLLDPTENFVEAVLTTEERTREILDQVHENLKVRGEEFVDSRLQKTRIEEAISSLRAETTKDNRALAEGYMNLSKGVSGLRVDVGDIKADVGLLKAGQGDLAELLGTVARDVSLLTRQDSIHDIAIDENDRRVGAVDRRVNVLTRRTDEHDVKLGWRQTARHLVIEGGKKVGQAGAIALVLFVLNRFFPTLFGH